MVRSRTTGKPARRHVSVLPGIKQGMIQLSRQRRVLTQLIAVCGCAVGVANAAPDAAAPANTPLPVVVELYTSEGCSSCPPAESLASRLVAEQAKRDELNTKIKAEQGKTPSAAAPDAPKGAAPGNAGAPGTPAAAEQEADVIVLAFHVDYWDRLGWKDRFSTSEASARQRRIASNLGESVYTPMMVVQGGAAMVGSDESRVRAQIEQLSKPAAKRSPGGAKASPSDRVSVTVAVEDAKAGDALNVETMVSPEDKSRALPPGVTVLIALVEDGLETKVGSGENAGRSLTHNHVVREFAERTVADGKAKSELRIAKDVKRERASVITVAYDASGRVIGAVVVPVGKLK